MDVKEYLKIRCLHALYNQLEDNESWTAFSRNRRKGMEDLD